MGSNKLAKIHTVLDNGCWNISSFNHGFVVELRRLCSEVAISAEDRILWDGYGNSQINLAFIWSTLRQTAYTGSNTKVWYAASLSIILSWDAICNDNIIAGNPSAIKKQVVCLFLAVASLPCERFWKKKVLMMLRQLLIQVIFKTISFFFPPIELSSSSEGFSISTSFSAAIRCHHSSGPSESVGKQYLITAEFTNKSQKMNTRTTLIISSSAVVPWWSWLYALYNSPSSYIAGGRMATIRCCSSCLYTSSVQDIVNILV
ncbi:hypothetical protein POM88_052373 [Heracleum sosnowskyi]|uniref:Uncharacterized protein n=1 Tax=Heracleum sosnowskyi TaxID=360622 RepID=A0AAD8LYL5_9APIA|nr:hypothetical protein POM88_052373 [Heracleum sosnowskyi]